MIQILIDSPDKKTCTHLCSALNSTDYQFDSSDSYSPFHEIVRRIIPQIVIFDHIQIRHTLVRSRIKLLKELSPHVRIITVSHKPTKQDAEVVELGVFYYQCGSDWTELKRVIKAATESFTSRCNATTSSKTPS